MGKTRKRKSIVYEKVVLPAILASLPDGVVVVDEAGMIIEINAAAETLLQISGKENKGKELGQCVPNLKLKEILQSQKPRENIKLCKVIAYVKSSAKIIEKAQFMIEILSIILQDESDAEASIIL
ncbi:MAG: PAS domain-containing protein, partial [Firmicutes bacterium]|nr:PAS domain-containing protein [Bacillota bacterium]